MRLKNINCRFAATLACVLAGSILSSHADEVGEKGRDIFQKNHNAVVTIELVQKTTANGRSAAREAKQDITGTVISPVGLVVVSLSTCDPSEFYRRLSEDYKTEIEVTDIKILEEDGTELPAEIVLRDKDLDLAFIRPKIKPTTPMPYVDLSKSGTAQVLDEVIGLNRLRRAAGRAFSASPERISAVVQKPRTFYVPDGNVTDTGLGSPIFCLNGNVLGVLVMRAVNMQGAGNWRDCIAGIVLPAEDIVKGAAQAPEAKGDDAKKESAKPVADTKKGAKDPAKDAVAPILAPNSAK